jgi:SAM-dependent methyltransferase
MSKKSDLTKSQTFQSFKDKWENNTNLAFTQTLDENSDVFKWIVSRNGFSNGDELAGFLKGKKRILDAGCGNGRVTALLTKYADEDAEIVGIDLTAAHVAAENLKDIGRVSIFQKDLLDDLSDIGTFDFIYSQEVLHHTANPKQSFDNLVKQLRPGGEIAIYVYKIKAPLREYADDYVRNIISGMSYEESSAALQEITEFGRVISEKGITIQVPKVDILGIEAGEYDLQRFIYHFFFKCYWNNMFTVEENNAINYDWYHPQIATRHTLVEVFEWYSDNDLTITHEFVDHYGITVRGKKA